MSTTQHRSKRPFQPNITSYFSRDPFAPECDIDAFPASEHFSSSPQLPASFQASLLNVGMRVRKSVSEGYRGRTKAVKQLDGTQAQSVLSGSSGLVPYCGILKIGGHSIQPPPNETDLPDLQYDNDPPETDFFSSQESSASTVLSINATQQLAVCYPHVNDEKKRRREETDDDDHDIEAQAVYPHSKPISHTKMPNLDLPRIIAIPKSRRSHYHVYFSQCEMVDAEDFEEAKFLKPSDWNEECAST